MRNKHLLLISIIILTLLSCRVKTEVIYSKDRTIDSKTLDAFKALGKQGMNMIHVLNFNANHALKFVRNDSIVFEGKLTKDVWNDKMVNFYFLPQDKVRVYINDHLITKIDSTNVYRIVRLQLLKRNGKTFQNKYLLFFHNNWIYDVPIDLKSK